MEQITPIEIIDCIKKPSYSDMRLGKIYRIRINKQTLIILNKYEFWWGGTHRNRSLLSSGTASYALKYECNLDICPLFRTVYLTCTKDVNIYNLTDVCKVCKESLKHIQALDQVIFYCPRCQK